MEVAASLPDVSSVVTPIAVMQTPCYLYFRKGILSKEMFYAVWNAAGPLPCSLLAARNRAGRGTKVPILGGTPQGTARGEVPRATLMHTVPL